MNIINEFNNFLIRKLPKDGIIRDATKGVGGKDKI